MSLVKALLLSAILTWIVSEAIRAANSSGGYLAIRDIQISGHYLHFSWPLFIAAGGVIWGIFLLMK